MHDYIFQTSLKKKWGLCIFVNIASMIIWIAVNILHLNCEIISRFPLICINLNESQIKQVSRI